MTAVGDSRAHYPVAIIGSGPTGLTLANLLGIFGVETLVIERNATTVMEPRAVSIDDESLRTMQAAGVAAEVLKEIVPGYGSHYFSPSGVCFAEVEPTGKPYGYPRRNAFRQPILEQQLRRGLRRFGNITAKYGWRLETYDQTPNGVVLHVKGSDSEQKRISCDYLVGCDGAGSTVREHLGIMLAGETFGERWLIIDLDNSENTTPHTNVYCDARRPGISLPGPDRTRRFEFKLLPGERDEDLLKPDVVDELMRTHGADPRSTIKRKVVYRFHARLAPRWRVGRVLLAGDAAHLSPPFAGQGMNSGIRDAHNLAWKLASVVSAAAGQGLLDSYEQERREHVRQMIELALRMGKIMAPPNRFRGFLTQLAFRSLKIYPPARDYIAQMKYKPSPRFSSGFLVPDGRSERTTLIGRLFPQPHVLTCCGERVLLDDVLGNEFALLAYSAHPNDVFARFVHPVWDRLQVKRVAVVPKGNVAPPSTSVTVVTEESGDFAVAWKGYEGAVLLLRPDHYVAAAVRPADLDQGAAAVEALWATTRVEHDFS